MGNYQGNAGAVPDRFASFTSAILILSSNIPVVILLYSK